MTEFHPTVKKRPCVRFFPIKWKNIPTVGNIITYQCLAFLDSVHGIVHKRHVNIDGMDSWNTVLNPNRLILNTLTLKSLECILGFLTSLELDQTPIVNYTVFDGNLKHENSFWILRYTGSLRLFRKLMRKTLLSSNSTFFKVETVF